MGNFSFWLMIIVMIALPMFIIKKIIEWIKKN